MLLTCVSARRLSLLGLFGLLLAHAGTLYAQPGPDSVNLPVFTSPIDVTGLPLVMRVSAPDRESGRMVDIAVPRGFLGPKFSQLLTAPLSAQFDRFWSADPNPTTVHRSRSLRARRQERTRIRASGRNTGVAEVVVQVAAAGGGSQAMIMMVGLLGGETGCPNHPLTSTGTDDTFMLFGAGFAAGAVAIHLDNAAGLQLGAAVVRPDGSICERMQSPTATMAGLHAVVATQGGKPIARTNVTFVVPSVLH
jgi:hypothetical protein